MLLQLHVWSLYLLQDSGAAVSWDPIHLWAQMGPLAKAVVIGLFIMSAYSIGVMIDRVMAYNAARKQSRAFAPAVAGALLGARYGEAELPPRWVDQITGAQGIAQLAERLVTAT